jgi:type I restriction enzyme S subunit
MKTAEAPIWPVRHLGEVSTLLQGKAHEQNITDNGQFIVVNSKFVSTSGKTKKYADVSIMPAVHGDVLIVLSDVPNGRALARCFYVDRNNSYTVNQRIGVVRTESEDSKFLAYLLNRNKYFLGFDDGAKQTNLRKQEVLECPLSLPPVSEQKAIAKALSDTDALIASLTKLIEKERAIKTAAMQQLLTGKTRLPGFGEGKGYKDSELGRIPEDWEVVELGDLAHLVTGSTPTTRNQDFYGKDIFFVSPADLGNNKFITKAGKSLSQKGISHSRKVPAGSILFTCIGSTIGKCGIAESAVCFNQQINAVIAHDEHCDQFLFYQLLRAAPRVRRSASEQAVPIVNKTKFSETLIGMPPTSEEQSNIAKLLGDLDTQILSLEQKTEKYQEVKTAMMQQLLTGRTRLI